MFKPSFSTVDETIFTFPPVAAFISVEIPDDATYCIVYAAPTLKVPWIWSTTISLIPEIADTDNLKFLPKTSVPIASAVNKSPTEYPDPPNTIVAPIATPPLIVMSAVAFFPAPDTVVNGTSKNVNPPKDGVYPIPELTIVKLFVAIPAFET